MCGSVNAARPTKMSCITRASTDLSLSSQAVSASAASTVSVGHSASASAMRASMPGKLASVRKGTAADRVQGHRLGQSRILVCKCAGCGHCHAIASDQAGQHRAARVDRSCRRAVVDLVVCRDAADREGALVDRQRAGRQNREVVVARRQGAHG